MMNSAPLVSVVIPAYNHGRYIAEAVRSVLAQDYPSVELIVIDDGSTDDTGRILAGLGTGFYWESQENKGQASTLEEGWRRARGEILGYLSADDVLAPTAVSESVKALSGRSEAVASYPDYMLIDPESRPVRRVTAPDYDYRHMLVNVVCAPGPGAFFRRSAYERAGPWNPAYRQMPDYDFWLRMGIHGPFVRIPLALASFRVHEGSQTYSQVSSERAAEPVRIIEDILRNPAMPPEIRPARNLALANAHLISAQLHLRAGRIAAGRASIRAALGYAPRALLSFRAARLLANALFNRAGHRLLWLFRSRSS